MTDQTTPSPRRRSRVVNGQPPQQASQATNMNQGSTGRNWRQRGAVGMQHSQEAQAAQTERMNALRNAPYKPHRFYLANNKQGMVMVLDRGLDQIPFGYEHSIWQMGGQRGYVDEMCPGEWEPNGCPICNGDVTGNQEHPYYGMYLSIIDMTPYTRNDGTQVPFSRKLLVIKQGQHEEFFRLLNNVQQQYGSIRGTILNLARGNDSKSPKIGSPSMVGDTGRLYERATEEAIAQTFQHPEIKNKKGDVIVKANEQIQVFDYDVIMPEPSARDICVRYNLPAPDQTSGAQSNELYAPSNDAHSAGNSDTPPWPVNTGTGMLGSLTGGSPAPQQQQAQPVASQPSGGGMLGSLTGGRSVQQQQAPQASNVQQAPDTDSLGFPVDEFDDDDVVI